MGIYRHTQETFADRSGTIIEADLLGTIDTESPEYQEAYLGFLKRNRAVIEKKLRGEPISREEDEHLFSEAEELVVTFPPDDPIKPEHAVLRDLREAMLDQFELVSEKDMDRL